MKNSLIIDVDHIVSLQCIRWKQHKIEKIEKKTFLGITIEKEIYRWEKSIFSGDYLTLAKLIDDLNTKYYTVNNDYVLEKPKLIINMSDGNQARLIFEDVDSMDMVETELRSLKDNKVEQTRMINLHEKFNAICHIDIL